MTSPYLATPPNWFLLDTRRVVRAIVLQMRKDFEFGALEGSTETGFLRDQFLYGVRARYNAGFGDWRAAFGAQVRVGRRPLPAIGDPSRPSCLGRPPHLRAKGKNLWPMFRSSPAGGGWPRYEAGRGLLWPGGASFKETKTMLALTLAVVGAAAAGGIDAADTSQDAALGAAADAEQAAVEYALDPAALAAAATRRRAAGDSDAGRGRDAGRVVPEAAGPRAGRGGRREGGRPVAQPGVGGAGGGALGGRPAPAGGGAIGPLRGPSSRPRSMWRCLLPTAGRSARRRGLSSLTTRAAISSPSLCEPEAP